MTRPLSIPVDGVPAAGLFVSLSVLECETVKREDFWPPKPGAVAFAFWLIVFIGPRLGLCRRGHLG